MARRRGSRSLTNSAEFLRRVEEMHRFVQSAGVGLRLDAPHSLALNRLGAELRTAYLAISGETVVPWVRDDAVSRAPRPWE